MGTSEHGSEDAHEHCHPGLWAQSKRGWGEEWGVVNEHAGGVGPMSPVTMGCCCSPGLGGWKLSSVLAKSCVMLLDAALNLQLLCPLRSEVLRAQMTQGPPPMGRSTRDLWDGPGRTQEAIPGPASPSLELRHSVLAGPSVRTGAPVSSPHSLCVLRFGRQSGSQVIEEPRISALVSLPLSQKQGLGFSFPWWHCP